MQSDAGRAKSIQIRSRVTVSLVGILFVVLVSAACAAPAQPIGTPAPTLVAAQVTPRDLSVPIAAQTKQPLATASRPPSLTPTAFITPPSAGKAAHVPILMYHHIEKLPATATPLQLSWTVTPQNFDDQMAWLVRNGFHTVKMAQLAAFLKGKEPLPTKPIVISFDDGWEDDYSAALPILRKYALLATFYVYTNPLGREHYLTWAQLTEIAAAGMEIGSHTLSHPHLRTLTPEDAKKEVAESKATLEKRLNTRVTTFAYPFGEYNNTILDLVKRAGYESAVTIASGYEQRADALYQLHRIRISYGDSLQVFAQDLP